ncbi:endo alpha-1,4 polygalactosaminidase [Aliifodinibius sp. S!AR15-10]|uniref:endo alpha-1,4 polygalactosaminidase n=1 Tax=Aliifodinibius sp. S!AR15-10 TaxID=2950437 RepID=UPI002865DCD7|nr:endo alpha-1,4 polygalactosaminidase [Aliifodinibius sp. S!AR15-10]MDR8394470.1 endo alpha-1,4 polygalactosaminidase [Aliifodinibius sp. S!AR15-10]
MMYKFFPTILLPLVFLAATCEKTVTEEENPLIYRQRMISFVNSISNYAQEQDSDFIVIPQNGIQLLTRSQQSNNKLFPNHNYLDAIDGIGRESVFYGYNADNEATPPDPRAYINRYLQLAQTFGKKVMVTDYASDVPKMKDSYAINDSLGYISFAANHRELDVIPPYPEQPHEVNNRDIHRLDQAENYLYLLNTQNFETKSEFVDKLASTNYDLFIIDLFFHADQPLTPSDLQKLKTKANGGERLLIAYMSIGEAEDYRYYWKRIWERYPPLWLGEENPNWEGNYLVQYWQPEWQNIILGNEDAYLDRILAAGFDGVYLDLVDAYRNFEQAKEQES